MMGMKPIKEEGLDGGFQRSRGFSSNNRALDCCRGHFHHRVSLRIGERGFTEASCLALDQRGTSFNQVVYGGFVKWGYSQITNFHSIFSYKASVLGYPPIYGNLHMVWLKMIRGFTNPKA